MKEETNVHLSIIKRALEGCFDCSWISTREIILAHAQALNEENEALRAVARSLDMQLVHIMEDTNYDTSR